ncbi:NAD(P)/FAD-dependent oxidoreductase [soil metagenome]
MAGLAAARELGENGYEVDVLEASDRVGGRAQTVRDANVGLPGELGPEYIHCDPSLTKRLIRGAPLELDTAQQLHHAYDGGALHEIENVWTTLADALAEGPTTSKDDVSADTYRREQKFSASTDALVASTIESFYAGPLDDISVAGLKADGVVCDGDSARYRIRAGYGPVAEWLAARAAETGVRFHHNSRVRAIDWSGTRVRLSFTTPDASNSHALIADRAIVTLPVGVLRAPADQGVAFTPALPREHAAALAQLGMGHVVKLVLCFSNPVWEERGPLSFIHAYEQPFPTYWIRSQDGGHQITAWAGGPHATALATLSVEQLVEHALEGFAAAVGIPRAVLDASLLHHHYRDYAHDPLTRGAYSYTRVGGSNAPAVLARPMNDRLYLAGEATHAAYEGTVAGALASGVRAAREILRVEHHAIARAS